MSQRNQPQYSVPQDQIAAYVENLHRRSDRLHEGIAKALARSEEHLRGGDPARVVLGNLMAELRSLIVPSRTCE